MYGLTSFADQFAHGGASPDYAHQLYNQALRPDISPRLGAILEAVHTTELGEVSDSQYGFKLDLLVICVSALRVFDDCIPRLGIQLASIDGSNRRARTDNDRDMLGYTRQKSEVSLDHRTKDQTLAARDRGPFEVFYLCRLFCATCSLVRLDPCHISTERLA